MEKDLNFNLKLYSTGCPMCKLIEQSLTKKNIPYELITSEEEVFRVAGEQGFDSVPFAFDGEKYLSNMELLDKFI